jgi:amino acid adenylation domain-containing protein
MVEAYPLSHLQQGMLFHSISAPASGIYIEQLTAELLGALEISVFQAAWEEMINQHAALRTAFAWRGLPEPLQVVLERVKLPLVILDWRDLPGELQQQRLSELRAAERLEGFDLSHAPLMRIKLIRMSDVLHQFVWTWHHVILDAWSVPMIVEGFFKAYDAHKEGRALNLEPGRPYKDFVAWQRSQDLSQAEVFWRQILDGFQEPTPFGVDGLRGISSAEKESAARQSAANGSPGYGLEFLEVPPGEIDALRDAARRAKVTLNTFMQGAWALLLSRYSGREDVLFGTAVSGRPPELAGIESMVGLLINTLPVRVKTPPTKMLGQWLEELQKQQAETRRYEYTPLIQLQSWSCVPRGEQLFDSLLVFENFPLDIRRIRSKELNIGQFNFVERANLPLTVMMAVREQSKIGADYDQSRFDAATIKRMLCHLRQLLADMTGDPERRLGDLDFLTDSERRQILEDFSRGEMPVKDSKYSAELSISQLFEAQVEKSPDALAVAFMGPHGEVSLTYRELNARANSFARHLRALGTGPEQRVAICMESSLSRLVAVMAVMKAGGVYVPLDPTFPEALLCSIIDDCGAHILLTQPDIAASLSTSHVIIVDEEWERSLDSGAGRENLTGGASSDNLAYLIYTSGSTGRPKGVAVTHASLRHLVEAQVEAFRIEPHSKVLQFSSLSFDASVSEIFTALLSGAQLYTAPRKLLTPSRDLLHLMERWGITTVTFPPSVLSCFPHSELSSLKTLVSAGEACPPELVARWAPGRLFLNAYGPTECTVCATVAEITSEHERPPIGRAIGEARVYILDSNMHPVPIGVTGELYVGGPGVARGYWGRPDLTASSFRPDIFSGVPGSRLYRTGDAACFLPNGEIEFLGRLDDQVKVRGFRIELTEVEAALRKEPALRDAAVAVAGSSADERRLVAYVVPEGGNGDDRAASRPEWWPSISEYYVYDELAYHAMTSDERRNISYRAAIKEKVRDKVVVEVGTGPEVLLARFCVEAGARKVYAIEILQDTYDRASERVFNLGLEDRIEVIHGDATAIDLPELADVCVSEIVGAIGGSEAAAAILNQVWRLLGEKAEMIPSRSTTMYAPVELPQGLLDEMGFGPLPARYVNKIFNDTGHPFDLRLCVRGLNPSHLLARPQVFEDLDFHSTVDIEYNRQASYHIERDGKLDGFLVWLTLDTGAGARLDILEHEHCWLPVFFPILEGRITVSPGDQIETRCGGVLCEDARHLDYFVEGTLFRQGQEPTPFHHYSSHQGGAFQASPFYKKFFQQDTVPLLEQKPRPSPSFDIAALKQRLRQRLPEYMIPSEFIRLDKLPLMASGKLARQALPSLVGERDSESSQELAPPRSQAEIVVAEIWQKLLPISGVGLQSNFFELGGHSLLLLRVQDFIQAELNVEIPVTDLFKYPTVETLAHRLSQKQVISRQEEDGRASSRKRALVRREALTAKAEAKAKIKSFAKHVKTQVKDRLKEPSKAILTSGNKPGRKADAQE